VFFVDHGGTIVYPSGTRGAIISFALAAGIVALASAPAFGATRQIPSSGSGTLQAAAPGVDGIQNPEIPPGLESDEGTNSGGNAGSFNRSRPGRKLGVLPHQNLETPVVGTSAVAGSNPEVALSFRALNHREQRLANGGNQFSIEPPDQGFCVGNGFVVEAINSVLRVWDTSGTALTGVQDLNTFFGYAAAINRTTGAFGADVIDPICTYDPDNNRFVVAITTLHHVGTTSAFNGKNTIDVAVSNTGDPTGVWTIYRVPAQNDGTDGTPNHHCLDDDGVSPGPCFQDYPHIGGDRNGIYISTNEYSLFGPGYNGTQVFAFSKAQLAAHPAVINATLLENLSVDGTPGFTAWPATSPVGHYSNERNGTEYLLSTIADVCPQAYCTAKRIGLWAITNTASLDAAAPALDWTSRTINSPTYVDPPKANQKAGDIPLGECLNDNTLFGGGIGCWALFFAIPAVLPPSWQPEVESHPDANDTRMQQTWYANGTLWGAAATGAVVNGDLKAGIVWFAVSPKINGSGKVEGQVKKSGYLALANNNLTYPAIAIGASGHGAIAFTVVGGDYYPSAGYALIDASGNVGDVHVAAAGLGPTDGFTSYKAFVGNPPRTRWGDYGAAVTDGTTVWIASEYVAQTCTLAQYLTGAIGSCGGTRTSLGNWATRITKLNP
jgi:hypothetical protein